MSGFSRRRLLLGGLGLGAATAVGTIGCSTTRASDTRISFLNWQDYIDPTILTDFKAATGLAVGYETYESNDALLARLNQAAVTRKGGRTATSFDLIVPSSNLFRQLRRGDALQPLDTGIVTSALLANLDPQIRASDVDPGNRYSVPWGVGTTGIGYDTTVFHSPPSWDVFLDSAYAGRMSLLSERRDAFAAALLQLGEDPNTTNPATIAKAESVLVAMKRNAAFNSASYLNALADGKLVAAQGYSTDVLQARKRNPKIAYAIPEQGGTRWIDLLCIPKDAPNATGANKFAAFYLDPKVSATNVVYNLVSTGNNAAEQFVPKPILEDSAVYPPASVLGKLAFVNDLGDAEKLYDQAWERIQKS